MGKVKMTPKRTREAIKMRTAGMSWQDIGDTFGCSDSTASRACYAVGKRNPSVLVALKNVAIAAIRTGSNNSRHCYVKPEPLVQPVPVFYPETHDQKLTGTPPLCRSALNEFETDGRGNVSKREPRVSFGAISIPDIRINSHSN